MEISKRRKIRGLEEWKIGNDEFLLCKNSVKSLKGEWVKGFNDTSVVMPECSCRASRSLGFTLVELVIVIAIVIVLSVVSVPIYRSYVEKAKYTEGYALAGTLLTAEKSYYAEHGYFYHNLTDTNYMPDLGVDARGNKYFTYFHVYSTATYVSNKRVDICVKKPAELCDNGKNWMVLNFSLTKTYFYENNW